MITLRLHTRGLLIRRHPASALLALLGALGCSGGSGGASGAGGAGGGAAADGSMGDPNILIGTFQVRLVSPVAASGGSPAVPGSTAVLGKVYDGPTPQTIVWEEKKKEGACVLSTPRVPFCNTPCGGSAACVENDVCQAYPTARSAGAVKVTGLHTTSGETTFTMNPVANNYQPPAGVSLPFPAFAEGDAVTLVASGDSLSGFSLSTQGIAPLELSTQTFVLESGKDFSLVWIAPGKPGISSVHVKLDISHHGGTKGMIECDTEDSGTVVVPKALLTDLLALGAAGFPSVVVTRSATGQVIVEQGRIDLVVSHSVEKAVEIPGLVSCTADTDCPSGQVCQADLTCK